MKKLAHLKKSKFRAITDYRILALSMHLFASLGIAAAQTGAEPAALTRQHTISVEVDPAPFILKGYSFSVRYTNQRLPNWSIMASAFAADFPNSMVSDLNQKNGWKDLKFSCSKALFVDYHFKQTGKGLFIGPSVFTYHSKATNSNTQQTVGFTTIYPNLRIGYTWFPFRKLNLYATPWLNIGKEFMTGSTKFTGIDYQVDNVKYILALHIGYRYSFNRLFRNKKGEHA